MREQNGTGGAGASTGSDGKETSSSSKKGGAATTNSATSAAAKPSADEKEEKLVRMVRLWGLLEETACEAVLYLVLLPFPCFVFPKNCRRRGR